uniref:SHSP domain-containing protein n=1 Tax=Kalanchoe fedtschenkoi TaxID=63787 RepID=A0A7N0V0N0_KALFE
MAALRALRTMRDRRLGRLPLYEEISPSARWTDDAGGRSLIIDLPEFKKEEVNLEVDGSENVTIKGRHSLGNNRFRRFSMTVKVPENTDVKGIAGNLEGASYTVVFPKMAVAEAVQEARPGDDEGRDKDGGVEDTEPEQKQGGDGGRSELSGRKDEGQEAVLDNEASKVVENAVAGSPPAAAAVATTVEQTSVVETGEKEAVTATTDAEIPTDKTETISAPMEKTLETELPEAEKAAQTLDSPTAVPQISTKMEQTATQEPENAQQAETEMKPAETASPEQESSINSESRAVKASENATNRMDPAQPLPEISGLSEIPKIAESPTPKTATILSRDKTKLAVNNEGQEHEGVKHGGGLLQNVLEKINEHKACIISVILAFSMGILISRKIHS